MFRLNITAVSSPASRQSPRKGTLTRGGKRKRTFLDESEESSSTDYIYTSSAKGDIEFSDICHDGKFVKVHNKGAKVSNIIFNIKNL